MIRHEILKVSELNEFKVREIREGTIEKLKERIKERGYNMAKSLTVVLNEGKYIVADGNHRLQVLKENNIESVPCVIYDGEGDIYNLAVQANLDEDTYAPMDLFDWLDVIGKLKDEGKTLKEIAGHLGWDESNVKKYSALLNKVPNILSLCKQQQTGRGTIKVPMGTFDFTERWFRDSGLYNLRGYFQNKAILEFLENPKKNDIKAITKKISLHCELVDYVKENLLDKDSEQELVTDVYAGVYKDYKQVERTVNNLNKAWNEKNNVRILHGDAFELIKNIPDNTVDLVLTDLPYNYSKDNNFDTMGRQGIDFGEWDKIADYDKFLLDTVKEISRTLRDGGSFYIFSNIINVSDLWRHLESNCLTPKRVMVWEKTNPIPTNQDRLYLAASEMFIWGTKGDSWTFNSKYESNVMRFATITDSDKRFHPTQKPDELFEKLISISSNPGDLVLDPFSGSGTTAFNCKKLKRRFIGFELDETYYKKSIARLVGDS